MHGLFSPSVACYPAVWRERDGSCASGQLFVGRDELRLEGVAAGRPAAEGLPYRELAAVRVERRPPERLRGRPTLVLERVDGTVLRLGLLGAGLLSEAVELLVELASEAARRSGRVAIVAAE